MSEENFTQHDVENKQLKEENEKLRKENENEKLETRNEKVEMTNENKQFKKNNIVKEEPKEIKSLNWFDKNKFKEILAIIDSNKFNYRNKIGEFKYIEKGLNTLNKIKNAEIIKNKKHTPKQKELLNLLNDLLDTILTNKTLKSKSQKDKTLMSSKNENENENENGKTLMSAKDDENENEHDKTLRSSKDDDETMNQNKKYIIKQWNDTLDEIFDKSKSFEEQINSIKKVEYLEEYWNNDDYDDKELKFKYFKLKLAHMSNIIDKKIFKQIFGHTLETLANKLIDTTNKEENQTISKILTKIKKNFTKKMRQIILWYNQVIDVLI